MVISPSGPLNPYAPPRAEVRDVPEAAGELAGRGSRLGAQLLDVLILVCIGLPAAIGAGLTSSRPLASLVAADFMNIGSVVSLIAFIIWLGATVHFLRRNGQSIGKRLLRIKVVRTDGSPASLVRIIVLRNICNTFLAMIPLGIGVIYDITDVLMIFSPSRRCLHDRIAGTCVVRA
jgi:uncharacterized RDD family membrane protein YckC